jgi:uncharacterized protein YebE (UPF0316 family)
MDALMQNLPAAFLPVMIFFARVIDVSLGTLRIIFISRGQKYLAPLLGFVEVFIWIVAVSQIMRGAHTLAAYLGYAAGFAVGNYVGMWIEARLAIGKLIIRSILPGDTTKLVKTLRDAGFGVTCSAAEGSTGPVSIIFTAINRKDLPLVVGIIHQFSPKAFLTVEELRVAEAGIFPRSSQPSFLGDQRTKRK